MSYGYQNRRICAVQAFCAAKSWRRWNSLPPSILITLGLSRLRRVKQKRAEWRVTSVFALRKLLRTSNSFVCALLNVPRINRRICAVSILRSKILAEVGFTSTEHFNYPWVKPPAARETKNACRVARHKRFHCAKTLVHKQFICLCAVKCPTDTKTGAFAPCKHFAQQNLGGGGIHFHRAF